MRVLAPSPRRWQKPQAQLVNPEKSLVGTIRSDHATGAEQSFRYAPLSSGLDIVRKTLSQHEIATVQTTSIDETAGIVRLSTVLAHASGFYIFVAAPQEYQFSYNLAAGAKTGAVTPYAGIPNQIIGVNTTPGFRGVGEVSLLRVAGSFLEWVGLETPSGAAITSGFSG